MISLCYSENINRILFPNIDTLVTLLVCDLTLSVCDPKGPLKKTVVSNSEISFDFM